TATGTKLVETKATGTVTFSNFDTGGANRIDAGSIVKTPSDVEFRTLATVTLPNATVQFPFTIVPSTASVAIEAAVAGPDGNVGNNSIAVDPAPLAAVAEARLRTRVTAGWTVLAGSVASEVGVPSVAGEVISYPVSVHATQVRTIDRATLVTQIKGLVLAEARARLDVY